MPLTTAHCLPVRSVRLLSAVPGMEYRPSERGLHPREDTPFPSLCAEELMMASLGGHMAATVVTACSSRTMPA